MPSLRHVRLPASLRRCAALLLVPALSTCDGKDPVEPEPTPPTLHAVSPASAVAGSGPTSLSLAGERFESGATVLVDGAARPTTHLSSTVLTVDLTAGDLASPDTLALTVRNGPDGVASNALAFVVEAGQPPVEPVDAARMDGGSISVGAGTCALATDGRVLCWGAPAWTDDPTRPLPIALPGAATAVQLGGRAGCALLDDGAAWCWGANDAGQLGRGTASTSADVSEAPAPVSGGLRFTDLDVGSDFVCGVTTDGEVHCWGGNDHGQLGDGGGARSTPSKVALPTPMADVATRSSSACALAVDGRLFCWGKYNWHADERHDPMDMRSPVPLVSLGTGDANGCGLSASSVLHCWYWMDVPLRIHGENTGTPFRSVAIRRERAEACGVAPDGRALCWGSNRYGELGVGHSATNSRSVPTPVETEHRFLDVAVGEGHTCGITVEGSAMCWGSDTGGSLGSGKTDRRIEPEEAAGGRRFVELSAMDATVCGREETGAVSCWGRTAGWSVGTPSPPTQPTPRRVANIDGARSVAARGDGGCALDAEGRAWCWGQEFGWAAGAVGGALRFDTLVAGRAHVCGLTSAGAAHCWGEGPSGQLGGGGFGEAPATEPVAVAGGHTFVALTAGAVHTCGIDTDGAAWCWGSDGSSQLGAYTDTLCGSQERCAARPLPLVGGGSWTRLDAGAEYTCGRRADGSTHCWGGQFNDEVCSFRNGPCSDVPVATGGDYGAVAIYPASRHVCAVAADGRAWCWGDSPALGSEASGLEEAEATLLADGALRFAKIVHGGRTSCGLAVDGAAWCWGRPLDGELGDGWTARRYTPHPVVGGHVFGR
ncbi:MAG: hypothetical protein RJQ04_07935 [Longimicrobiales bacterium]